MTGFKSNVVSGLCGAVLAASGFAAYTAHQVVSGGSEPSTAKVPPVATAPAAAPQDALAEAKDLVRARLTDPDSAQFRNLFNVTSVKGELVTCGEVNAKNQLGGYTGYAHFFIADSGHVHLAAGDVERLVDMLWVTACEKRRW